MIKLAINQNRLIQNLRYAFTNTTTVVAELMQNARRAGANRIDITFDGESNTLTVLDDGLGVADFQSLFTLADSSWNTETKESEYPFGMGFFSALFAANEVEVQSLESYIRFKTADILDFNTVVVKQLETPIQGTSIKLKGFDIRMYEMNNAVAFYSKGFSIPVFFQGKEMNRDDALTEEFEVCEVGRVRLAKSQCYICYLQGIPVYQNSIPTDSKYSIIHLSSEFKGKMPDRTTLFNQDESIEKIRKVMREYLYQKLLMLKSKMPELAFVEEYWELATKWSIGYIFNKIPYLPKAILGKFDKSGSSFNGNNDDDHVTFGRFSGVSKTQVESGEIVLCYGIPEYDGNLFFDAVTLAKRLNWVYVNPYSLPSEHWALSHIVDLSELYVQTMFVKHGMFDVEFEYGEASVALCESYTLTSGLHSCVISDEACYIDGELVIPSGSTGVESLWQIDCCYFGRTYDKDSGLLRRLVSAERTKLSGFSKEPILNEVLNSGELKAFSTLADSMFVIAIDSDLKPETIQINPKHLDRFNQFLKSLAFSENDLVLPLPQPS
ncbi:MAG: ATP-binding protein [Pseudomonadales bacterium]|nr:ATP-binding protein [Pseudomonadales bacterium]